MLPVILRKKEALPLLGIGLCLALLGSLYPWGPPVVERGDHLPWRR